MKKSFSSKAGVTLLETMLALSIISLSLFGIIHSFYLIDRSHLLTKQYTQGLFLAQSKANEIVLNNKPIRIFGGEFEAPFNNYRWDIKQKTKTKDFQKREVTISWKAFGQNKNENFTYFHPTHR